jgi:hypothetical protein
MCPIVCIRTADEARSPVVPMADLPGHVQTALFVLAGAPLTVCKASAAIAQDLHLTTKWFLHKHTTPLCQAAKCGRWDVCDHLLGSFHYKPPQQDLQDALETSAQQGDATLVSGLLRWCCQGGCQEASTRCSVCSSICNAGGYYGHLSACTLALQDFKLTAEEVRQSACDAASRGHLEVLEVYLRRCWDAGTPDLGGSPMCSAARRGQVKAMQLLYQHGVDVHNEWGTRWNGHPYCHPLEEAALHGHSDAVGWLVRECRPRAWSTAFFSHPGVEGSSTVSCGTTSALLTALSHLNWPVVQLLLEGRIRLDQNLLGRQPEVIAQTVGLLQRFLTRAPPEQSAALVHTAVTQLHGHLVVLLLEAGATVAAEDVDDLWRSLRVARSARSKEMMERLSTHPRAFFAPST